MLISDMHSRSNLLATDLLFTNHLGQISSKRTISQLLDQE